jgi:signal peptidase II
MSSARRAWLLAGALCALVAIADQVAKAAVERDLTIGEQVDVLGPLGLTLSHNRGVAFGLAWGGGALLILFTVLALGFVVYLFSRNPARPGMWVAVGLVAGGAIGNLVDRVRHDQVTDFVDLSPWPPFNLADVAISFGALLLVFLYLRDSEGEKEPQGG